MNDAATWALIALAVTGWGYAFALAMELKRLRKLLEHADERAMEDAKEIERLDDDNLALRLRLTHASKNDNRDAKGRYAKA